MKKYKRTVSALGIGFLLAASPWGHADDTSDYSVLQNAMQKAMSDRNNATVNDSVFEQPSFKDLFAMLTDSASVLTDSIMTEMERRSHEKFEERINNAHNSTTELDEQIDPPINFDQPQHIVIDLQSGETITALHADEQRQPASLVKVMTLWLVMDAIKDQSLTTSSILPVPAGTARLSQGAAGTLNMRKNHTVGELMNKAGAHSNAYATITLAVGVAKAQKWVAQDATADEALAAFVVRMNEKAATHHMDKTLFNNVTGMRTNFSTPRDMATMFAQIYKDHPVLFRSALGGKSHSSRFQRNFNDAIGSKTGTLNECGLCLGSVYEKNNRTYIMVIFGMNSHAKRYGLAQNLYAQTPATYLPLKDVPLPIARPSRPAAVEDEGNNNIASSGSRKPNASPRPS